MMDTQECQACGGDVRPLGPLGDVMHGKCRACGLTQEMDVEDSEEGEQDGWLD